MSLRRHWVPPLSHPQASVAPPLTPRGETHSLAGEGLGGPSSDEGTDTLELEVLVKKAENVSPYCFSWLRM
jgi:hypothetical protein